VQARDLERQLGFVKHEEVCLQRLHDHFRNVVKARPFEPMTDIDEIQARDLQLLQKQLEMINIELRDMKHTNEEVRGKLDAEILQKVTAFEQNKVLESQLHGMTEQLLAEQHKTEITSNALISSQTLLQDSTSELSEIADAVKDLVHKMNSSECTENLSPPILRSNEDETVAGSLHLLNQVLSNSLSNIATLKARVNTLEADLKASDEMIRRTMSHRDDMLDGLSRWESTCSMLEDMYVEQVKRLDDRERGLQVRIKMMECSAQEQEQHQRNSDKEYDSLNQTLISVKAELEARNRQMQDLLFEVKNTSSTVFAPWPSPTPRPSPFPFLIITTLTGIKYPRILFEGDSNSAVISGTARGHK
jgi:hypothetical protein